MSDELRAVRAGVVDGDLTGVALRDALCDVTDDWLRRQLGDEPDVALVAVGGHGRRELTPGSDLDLLLLHRDRADIAVVAERMWYPIWDAGVKLDHSMRTVGEAVAVSRDDLKALLGLVDARLVAGDVELVTELRRQVLDSWRRDARRRLPELRAMVDERGQRFGELAFLLEPDLKESYGGLRDVHVIAVVAAAWLADPPSTLVREASSRLLDVRSELHRVTGRATDRLVAQEQLRVATRLEYADADALMRDVYEAARTIAYDVDETWRRVEASTRPSRRWRQRQPVRRPLADDVVEQDGEVVLARDAEPADDPVLLLRVAAAAADAGLPIARHTLDRLVTEAASLPEPWPRAALDAFLTLLGAGEPMVRVWESLDRSGLLIRLLPEWDTVRCKPQRNPVHRFTVDRHLVEAAVEASSLTRYVHRPDLLLIAALLHDIGKGYPGDHTDAGVRVVPAIARRLGLADADIEVLVTLVRHHLLLPDTATRRDLDDSATVTAVADAVGDRSTLELLHALTECDGKATGPAAWGDWKAGLVRELASRTSAVLAGEPPSTSPVLEERVVALVDAGGLHVDVDGDQVSVVAPDRPGLLWRWAGVLALHRLQIRAATAMSVGPTAVTVFTVTPRFGSPPDWNAVRADVRRVYDDPSALASQLAARDRAYASTSARGAPRVIWLDDVSESATVIELRTHDAVGLLYRVTRALADAGLDVRSARMSTLGAEVVDAFYVLDERGGRVDDDVRRASITDALVTACRTPD